MKVRHALAAFLVLTLPLAARADVRISEVAWMGSSSNANAEWIELENTGSSPVPLAGWKITSSTGAPVISLSGTIDANGFFLLTRTSTSIITGVTGDQAYSGALPNGGATLTLTDGSGAVVDTVAGGTNWANIGGDNATKQTPQLASDGTWVTADPTPRASTVAAGTSGNSQNQQSSASSTPTVSIGGTVVHATNPTFPQLYIDAGANRIVPTHAETPFTARIYGSNAQPVSGALTTWTFGDGTQDIGTAVQHAFAVPGTYLVIVRATNGYAETIQTLTVIAEDTDLSVESSPLGVTVANGGEHIADLSHWKLQAAGKRFDLPADTALLPSRRIMLPPNVTGLSYATDTVLLYPNGEPAVVATTVEQEASTSPLASDPVPATPVVHIPARVSAPLPLHQPASSSSVAPPPSPIVPARSGIAGLLRRFLPFLR